MRNLTVLSEENGDKTLLDALTNAHGIHGEPFLVVKQDKKHMGPNGLQEIHWQASFRLTHAERGAVRLQLTKDDFPTGSVTQIKEFYKRKVIPKIEQLAQKIGVSVRINLDYQRRSSNVGIVTPL